MASKEIRAACMAAALAGTLGSAHAGGVPIQGVVTPNVALDDCYYFTLNFGGSGELFVSGAFDLGNFPGNEISEFNADAGDTPDVDVFLGVYDEGAWVAFDPGDIFDVLGKEFDEVFVGRSEADLVDALQGDDLTYLESFVTENSSFWAPMGEHQGVKFSAGALGGTVFTSVVPEPATMAVLALGMARLVRRRRR